jgi:hypothetical protein
MKLRTILATLAVTGSILTAAPALATSPVITGQTNSVSTVYPVVDGYVDSITFGWTLDQAVTSLELDVMDASTHTSVFQIVFDDPATTGFVWNGTTTGATVAPAGTYYARVTANNGTDPADSNNGPLFVLSGKKLTAHTWTKQFTAGSSVLAKAVGTCSKVARPGTKLGTGSVGYYSNVTCTKAHQDYAATLHQLQLPQAFKPGKVTVSTYGAAVKAGSVMRVGFFTDAGWKVGSAKGWHTGPTRDASPLIGQDGLLMWQSVATGGNRYDIKYFKLTYTYTVLA